MTSKTRMLELVRAWDHAGVDAALRETPALAAFRDPRGRNWLHITCMVELKPGRDAADSVRTADALLSHGFDIDAAAFTEGDWRATPVWHVVSRGRNLVLLEHLLTLGADPNHSLWAAGWNDDADEIRLLLRFGARLEDVAGGETPFRWCVSTSRFAAAEEMLKHGADPNAVGVDGLIALHVMLRKGSDAAHVRRLLSYGARGDIPGPDGRTAIDILRRKRDPAFRAMADALAVPA